MPPDQQEVQEQRERQEQVVPPVPQVQPVLWVQVVRLVVQEALDLLVRMDPPDLLVPQVQPV